MKTLACLTTALVLAFSASASSPVDWTGGVSYDYDAAGNIRQIGTDHHVYDVAGRLVQSDANGIQRKYSYDAFGNRIGCEQPPGTGCQYYGVETGTNRLSGVPHDGAGNVMQLQGHLYDYDALNLQTTQDATTEYIYTADDERIAIHTTTSDTWRWTLRDASAHVLREMTSVGVSNWTWTKDYVWRGSQLLASRQIEPGATAPSTYHYHLDHLGTPRRITNDTDTIVGIHDYHAFGREIAGGTNEPSLSLLKFTGHERDLAGAEGSDTLDYMHARYYSATAARFLSVDPVWESADATAPQSWNRYSYVRNGPMNASDPTGEILHFANVTSADYYDRYLSTLDPNSDDFKNAKQLENSDITYVLSVTGLKGKKEGEVLFDGASVMLNLDSGGPTQDASMNSRLAHEIQHGVQVDEGRLGFGIGPDGNWRALFGDVHDEVEAWNAQARQADNKDHFSGNLRDYLHATDKAQFLSKHGYPGYRGKLDVISNAPRPPGYAPGSVVHTSNLFYRVSF